MDLKMHPICTLGCSSKQYQCDRRFFAGSESPRPDTKIGFEFIFTQFIEINEECCTISQVHGHCWFLIGPWLSLFTWFWFQVWHIWYITGFPFISGTVTSNKRPVLSAIDIRIDINVATIISTVVDNPTLIIFQRDIISCYCLRPVNHQVEQCFIVTDVQNTREMLTTILDPWPSHITQGILSGPRIV